MLIQLWVVGSNVDVKTVEVVGSVVDVKNSCGCWLSCR